MKPLITVREGSTQYWLMRAAGLVLLVVSVLWIATKGSNSLITDMSDAMMFAVAAMSLNLVLGYSGMISLGHSAFFGVGSYVTGVLISRYGWSPWLTFLAAFVLAFVVGMVVSLPALRIKGIYLALVTLSLALLFPHVVKWKKLEWLTGGAAGLKGTTFDPKMRRFEIFGIDFFGNIRGQRGKVVFQFWIIVAVAVITYLVCRGIVRSRVGRSLIAMRDNETAAAVMGVPIAATKALVFGVSAGLCALAGSWSAIRIGNVTPTEVGNFSLVGAINFLVVMVVGGAGTLTGPIVGAIAFVWISSLMSDWATDDKIPALLRPLFGWAKLTPATGVFATVLIVLMFVAPYGLVGLWKRNIVRVVGIVPAPAGSLPNAAPADEVPLASSLFEADGGENPIDDAPTGDDLALDSQALDDQTHDDQTLDDQTLDNQPKEGESL